MNWYKKAQQYIAYHGTNQDFDAFSIGGEYQDRKSETSLAGFWFTASINEAEEYANYSAERNVPNQIQHANKVQDYLKKINQAEKIGNWELYEKLMTEVEELEYGAIYAEPTGQKIIEVILTLNNPYVCEANNKDFDMKKIINEAKKNKYDGIIFNNILDRPKMLSSPEVGSTTQYLVFDRKNIKINNIKELNQGNYKT